MLGNSKCGHWSFCRLLREALYEGKMVNFGLMGQPAEFWLHSQGNRTSTWALGVLLESSVISANMGI